MLIRAYEVYPFLVDFLLYFFVLAAAARVGFAKTFPGYEGKLLSIAVGVLLAAGLTMAQRTLGFSTEKMGPIAVFLLCGIVFLAAYKFLQHSDIPKPMTIFICSMLVLALFRAAMPKLTAQFFRNNSMTVILIVCGLLGWMWYTSGAYVKRIHNRTSGQILARAHTVPDDNLLRKEKRFVKKRIRNPSRTDARDERAAASNMGKVRGELENKGITSQNRPKILARVEEALRITEQVRQRSEKLLRFDDALRQFDLHWFRKMHSVDLGQLTPAQQQAVQQAVLAERKRVNAEEEIEKLETQAVAHVRAQEENLARCRQAVESGNTAGAQGWLNQALEEEKKARALERRILDWEQRLLRLIRRQKSDLDNTA